MSKHEPEAGDDLLPEKALKELFAQSHDRGRAGLPVMSLSMSRGLVPRDRDERRVETNLGDEEHRLVRSGELAYNMMRMWQGVCSLAEQDCLVSPAYVVIRPLDGTDPRFAEYLLTYQETVAQFKRLSFGVVDDRLRLYYKDFERVRVRVPSPAAQRKIAEILTTLDNLIEKTEALIAKYQSIRQGMLYELLTRGLDEHGHIRPPYDEAQHLYKPSPIGRIPIDWRLFSLGDLATVGGGVTLGRKPVGSEVVELPYLRVANVQDGYLDLDEIKSVRILRNEMDRYSLQSGDLLMTEGGDFDKLGRGTVWRAQIHPCLHQNHIFRVRPRDQTLSTDYLAILTSSFYGRQYFLLNSKQTTNLASINSTQIKAFPVPVPRRAEQDALIALMTQCDAKIGSEIKLVRKLNLLKLGLLEDLLTGKVRVQLEPDEEAVHV